MAQGAYTSEIAVGETKGELFGLFWGLKSGSQIFGAVITTFVLGNLTEMTYFTILSGLGRNPYINSSPWLYLILVPSPNRKVTSSRLTT